MSRVDIVEDAARTARRVAAIRGWGTGRGKMRKLSALHPPMTASPATASAMYGCALASFARPAAESWYFAQHACADACAWYQMLVK
jgi:hypothetical protein